MPFVRGAEAVTHEVHGARFTAYANPGTGSRDLAAWRTEVPAGSAPVPHVVSHEEVFYLLSGEVRLTIDGDTADLLPGDAAVAPAGSRIAVANRTDEPARMWVTTRVGLTATLGDGSTLTPPWANHRPGTGHAVPG
ncbi:cupin [Wenjunlia vitaminophila]|uniref:Cupin n=1 Tax=Wenjunlia vitaminophila TaxID=76728 RepID=A0A0T6LS03_WENVI|nr:cupin domain-containing protein [Wenjunlia vitaminophila]KRV48899.1 cupin [Wenjunlia vitaminophila]